jgi:hypothetical protein
MSRWISVIFVSLLLAVSSAQNNLIAQDQINPEELFYYLLDNQGYSLDETRTFVASEFDEDVAAEIAAYLCAPDPDLTCEGSDVLAEWDYFLDEILDDRMVIDVAEAMLDAGVDEPLVTAIAVYWCSPEPGPGCEDEYYNQTETGFAQPVEKALPASKGSSPQFANRARVKRSRIR